MDGRDPKKRSKSYCTMTNTRSNNVAIAGYVWVLLIASVLPGAHGFGIPRSTTRNWQPLAASVVVEGQQETPLLPSPIIHHVTLEYCNGCHFLTRTMWMAQELLTTFNDAPLSAVTLTPRRPPPSGKFAVTFQAMNASTSTSSDTPRLLLWDRHVKKGFPDIKELKQLVRDQIDPARYLGHSDKNPQQQQGAVELVQQDETMPEEAPMAASSVVLTQIHVPLSTTTSSRNHHVAIQYCTGCRWMLRSAYLATELLTTLEDDIDALTLIPSRPPEKGGIFVVTVNGKTVWDRAQQGGFPQPKQLKELVRDIVAPTKSFGHSRIINPQEDDEDNEEDNGMDEDEAQDMRAYYGVL
jgi:selenoprotein W-related protein